MLMKESEDLAEYRVTIEKYRQEGEKIISSSTGPKSEEKNPKEKTSDRGKGKDIGKRKKGVYTAEKEKEILSAIKKVKVLPANSDEKNKKSESKHITDSTKELEPRKRSCKSNFIYINFMSLHVIQQALA